jgi:hypothetical protein
VNRKSRFSWCTVPGAAYTIVVHGFEDAEGEFELSLSSDGVPCARPPACAPCIVACPPGATPEVEANCGLPVDTTNGGCDTVPARFLNISCGQTYCSTAGAQSGLRDGDWYRLSLNAETLINWCVTPEFPAIVGIVNTGGVDSCTAVEGYLALASAAPCETVCLSACLFSGHWYLYVAPQPLEGVCCGSQYTATVQCGGCAGGACCLPDGECLEVENEAICTLLEGVAFFEADFCVPDPCPGTPANDQCADAQPVSDRETLFDVYLATTDGPAHAQCTFFEVSQIYNDIWFTYVATCEGHLRIETCGSERDTKLAVYDTTTCGAAALNASLIACNDDGLCGGLGSLQSAITIETEVGAEYLIRVGTFLETVPGPSSNVLTITCSDCEGDCAQPPDGRVNVTDLLALLSQWGVSGPCNVDGDAATDVGDLLILLADWGPCP